MTCHAGLFSRDDTQARIEALFKETRPVCFGRFLVDVPKDAYVVGNTSEYRGDQISVKKMISLEKFQKEILAKEKLLKETKHETEPSLLKHISKSDGGKSINMIFWEDHFAGYVYETEAYKWISGNQFLIKGKASQSKVAIAVDMANRSLAELQYRDEKKIPTQPGFCIDDGFFAGEPSFPHYESAFLNLQFKSHPDIRVTLSTCTNVEPQQESLLERVDRKSAQNAILDLLARIKVLRRGKHPVGDIQAEEYLQSVPTGETFSTHMFAWEASGKAQDIYAPGIVVEMQTGKPTLDGYERPTVSDREALQLFDAIINSIRIRPTTEGTANPGKPAPPPHQQSKTSLGTQLASGTRCPQSGTWACNQAEALGGNRRFFNTGETLPSVLLPISRNLWQSLRGDAANQSQATTWTLVALPEDTE